MVATTRDLKNDIDEIMPGVIADRRHLHQHPELGFQEFETAKLVAERMLAAQATREDRLAIADDVVVNDATLDALAAAVAALDARYRRFAADEAS